MVSEGQEGDQLNKMAPVSPETVVQSRQEVSEGLIWARGLASIMVQSSGCWQETSTLPLAASGHGS